MEIGKSTGGPSVTVIVLTYGCFDGLGRTLKSVTEQTYPMEAVLVSDDGSGKEFPAELRNRYAGIPFRTNSRNLGTVAHMNAAADGVRSDYIKFLSAGDAFSDPDALGALARFARRTGGVVVASQSVVCDESLTRRIYSFPGKRGRKLARTDLLFQNLAVANRISAAGTLFRRSFFEEYGGFDEKYRLLEDWPAWLRLAREGHTIPFLDRVTCLYALGGVSSEHLDAYGAPQLREDMLLCYEKEILPYLKDFSPKDAKRVRYGYDRVRGLPHGELLRKYGWLERKSTWKRSVKRWLLKQ